MGGEAAVAPPRPQTVGGWAVGRAGGDCAAGGGGATDGVAVEGGRHVGEGIERKKKQSRHLVKRPCERPVTC
jgi:hypothetical protein